MKYCCFYRNILIEGRRQQIQMHIVAVTPWKTQLFFLTQQMLSQTNHHMETFYYFLIIRWACENYMLIESGKYPANIISWKFKTKKSACHVESCHVGQEQWFIYWLLWSFSWCFSEEKEGKRGRRERALANISSCFMPYVIIL